MTPMPCINPRFQSKGLCSGVYSVSISSRDFKFKHFIHATKLLSYLLKVYNIHVLVISLLFITGGAVFGSNVVNVESWRSVATLRGHEGDILDVAWSPNDVWLASASIDNNVIIWNTAKWPGKVNKTEAVFRLRLSCWYSLLRRPLPSSLLYPENA